ncbi:MAG: DUF1501 domain-containing protein, partial [Planctomycetota bacterium]
VLEQGTSALLAQEIRNARGGQYTLTILAGGDASTADVFDSVFVANFTFRLALFRFNDIRKDPRSVTELASTEFVPNFGKPELFTLDRFLGSTTPGSNFTIGSGLGIRVVIEKKTPGQLVLSQDLRASAALRIESVCLSFSPRIRDDSVTA